MSSADFPLDISKYEVGSLIGRGATSEVYSAKCLENGKLLAIKMINLEVCPIEIENLHAEVAFWSNCRHPNVVEYYGSFVDKSVLYILMEYMSGGSCYEIMRFSFQKGIQKEAYIATILREVLKALDYFHENKQIHRDIKAGNILINDKGEVKIADFGIAAKLLEQGQRKRARFTVIGTPCYMAPEILAAGIGYTEKADIWSLGITAIELATGSAPYANLFPLEVIVRISNSPPPTLPDDKDFSSAFRDFVKQCLQSSPSKRATAHQLLESKFIKQSVPINQIARAIIAQLPPLQERFSKIHAERTKDKEKEKPAEVISWDFAGVDSNNNDIKTETDEQTKPEQEVKPQVLKKGKFTITKQTNNQTNEEKIKLLEDEIETLKKKIEDAKAENEKLNKTVKHLEKKSKKASD